MAHIVRSLPWGMIDIVVYEGRIFSGALAIHMGERTWDTDMDHTGKTTLSPRSRYASMVLLKQSG